MVTPGVQVWALSGFHLDTKLLFPNTPALLKLHYYTLANRIVMCVRECVRNHHGTFMAFSLCNFPTNSRPKGDLGQGAHPICVMMILRPVGLLLQLTDNLVLSYNVGLPASSVSSLWISVTRLAGSHNELRMWSYSNNIVKMCQMDIHIEIQWSILETSGSILLKTQLCLWKWREAI